MLRFSLYMMRHWRVMRKGACDDEKEFQGNADLLEIEESARLRVEIRINNQHGI